MDHSISLFQERTQLSLSKGKYNLYFLGGYEVLNEGDFIIGLFNLEMTEQVKFEFATRIRVRINGRRGVKYFQFELSKNADYLLLIQRPDELTIKKSILTSFNFFHSPIQASDKKVYIERVYDR
ncbi:MAG: hypothetical protein AB8B56_04490 [Crocinitomicaceae bacterium]